MPDILIFWWGDNSLEMVVLRGKCLQFVEMLPTLDINLKQVFTLSIVSKYFSILCKKGGQSAIIWQHFSTYFRWLIGRCSLVFGASIMQDKDLGMYNPAESRTSRHLSCSHELCDLGTRCKSPKQPCPYTVSYYSENTSSSGLLVEDTLRLATSGEHTPVQAAVIIGYVQIYWDLMLDCKILTLFICFMILLLFFTKTL